MFNRTSLYILIMLLTLTGCSSVKLDTVLSVDDNDWYVDGGNGLKQRRTERHVGPALVEKWRNDVGAGTGIAGPLIVDGKAFVGTRKGQLVALELQKGKTIGRERFDVPIEAGMAINDSLLFIPLLTSGKSLIAYDLRKGKEAWTHSGQPIESSLLVHDNLIFAADVDANVFAFGVNDGVIRWQQSLGDESGIIASPILVENYLMVVNDKGLLVSFEAHTGSEVWRKQLEAPVFMSMTSDGHVLFVPTTRGILYSIDVDTGDTEWVFTLPDSTVRYGATAYDPLNGRVIVASTEGVLRALDARDGSQVWHSQLDGASVVAPVLSKEYIFAGTLRGKLYAIDRYTGQKYWETDVGGRIKSAITSYQDYILVMAETQKAILFEAAASTSSSY